MFSNSGKRKKTDVPSSSSDEPARKKPKTQKKMVDFFEKNESGISPNAGCLSNACEKPNSSKMEIGEDDKSSEAVNTGELSKLTRYIERLKRRHTENQEEKKHDDAENREFLTEYPKYENRRVSTLETSLENFERDYGDYFGEDFSADSDSDDEEKYEALRHIDKQTRIHDAYELIQRAKIMDKATELAQSIKDGAEAKKSKSLHEYSSTTSSRQKIYRRRVKPTKKMREDLRKLNDYVSRDELTPERYAELKTPFVVVQVRGIHFYTDRWTPETRREARKNVDEGVIGKALYSSAAKSASQEEPGGIQKCAEKIHDRLSLLRLSGRVRVPLTQNKKRKTELFLFDNALLALQSYYTKDYDKFHRLLATVPFETDSLQKLILSSVATKENPFVSTSDLPHHALRYALGDKYYPSQKALRLRPRWHKSGRAERPHAGLVYVSLHSPLDLMSSNHLPSLTYQVKVSPSLEILGERETSFFGCIPENKVFYIHKARVPSFHKPYRENFLIKYGFTKEFYELIQQLIERSKPHSDERKQIKNIIISCLIAYYEAKIIDAAVKEAENKKAMLIYRSETGGFMLESEPSKAQAGGNSHKSSTSAQVRSENVNKDKNDRKESKQPSGFLFDLQKNFFCFSLGGNSIGEMLFNLFQKREKHFTIDFSFELPSSADEEFNSEREFTELCEKLHKIVQLLNVQFEVFYAKNKNPVIINKSDNDAPKIHLYYCGGGVIKLLEKKKFGSSSTLFNKASTSAHATLSSSSSVATGFIQESPNKQL